MKDFFNHVLQEVKSSTVKQTKEVKNKLLTGCHLKDSKSAPITAH